MHIVQSPARGLASPTALVEALNALPQAGQLHSGMLRVAISIRVLYFLTLLGGQPSEHDWFACCLCGADLRFATLHAEH
jgi:hypothetical protein